MSVSIQPVVNWPREVTVGQAYLVTADIVLAEGSDWPYEREEFVVGCVLEGGSTFSVEALGSTGLVLHRFGGTYGPVEFVVRPLREPAAGGPGDLRLTFLTEGGLPFRTVQLAVRAQGSDSPAAPSTVVEVAASPQAGVPAPEVPSAPPVAPRRRPVAARAGRRVALLISLGSSSVNDGQAMLTGLAGHGFANIRQVSAASTEDVERAYQALIGEIGPDDAVFVHVSGSATPYFTAWHDRLAAVTPNVTVAFECAAFDVDAGSDVVQLFASGPGQRWYDEVVDGKTRGVFTAVLAQTLTEVHDRPITWAVVMDRVRRRVLDRHPLQRPVLIGPGRRVLFQLREAEPETALPARAAPDGTLLLDGAPLLGVQVGDEFAIVPRGATGTDEALCVAEVVALTPVAAVAEPRPAGPRTVPRGAQAIRTRAVAVATPIRAPAHDGLLAAMASSRLVRLATPDDHPLVEVRAEEDGRFSIHDEIGPVQDPRRADDNGLRRIITDLERLARAHALRTLTEDPRWAFDPAVEIEWGRSEAGRQQPLPVSGASVHTGDRIYFRVRNTGSEKVFLSLIDIGVAAGVTLLNSHDPGGIALHPGAQFVLGREPDDTISGLPVTWPQRLDPSRARPETVLVLITSAPQDTRMLEQQGVRSAPPQTSSMLERTLAQLTTGAALSMGRPDDRPVRYAVRPITFFLEPTPRPDTADQDDLIPADRLAAMAREIRGSRHRPDLADEEIISLVEQQIERYLLYYRSRRDTPQPPAALREAIPMMGWLLYEVSWAHLTQVPSDLDRQSGPAGERGRASAAVVHRMAAAARRIPWPEFAPRALGAFRSAALAEAKRDTEIGYDRAMSLLREARARWESFRDGDHRRSWDLAMDEIFLQLVLAETGTVCRIVERAIMADSGDTETVRPLFRELIAAAALGERALDVADSIERRAGFVQDVTADRLARENSRRNPAIMLARVLTLLYTFTPAMESLGAEPPQPKSWDDYRRDLLARAGRAVDALVRPVTLADGSNPPLRQDQQRALVQLLLNLAIVAPGHPLVRAVDAPGIGTVRLLDDDVAERASAWLATSEGGSIRGSAGVIGSAALPAFITSVEQCRRARGATTTYRDWRRRWPQLDQTRSRSWTFRVMDMALVLAIDIDRAGRLHEPDRLRARTRLSRAVTAAMAATGLDGTDTAPALWEDGGDGLIVAVPVAEPGPMAAAFLTALTTAISRDAEEGVRVRIAVHQGPAVPDRESKADVTRLVDDPSLHRLLDAAPGMAVAAIVSDTLRSGGWQPRGFVAVTIPMKTADERAWIGPPHEHFPENLGIAGPDWPATLEAAGLGEPVHHYFRSAAGSQFVGAVHLAGVSAEGLPRASPEDASRSAAYRMFVRLQQTGKFAQSIVTGAGGGGISGPQPARPAATPVDSRSGDDQA